MIFNRAYPPDDNLRVVSRRDWDLERNSNEARDPPSRFYPKVNGFLISKRFFDNVVVAWIGN